MQSNINHKKRGINSHAEIFFTAEGMGVISFSNIFLSAIAGSVVLNSYLPDYSVRHSYALTAIVLWVVQATGLFVWRVTLYPHYFSPLRHIPTAPGAEPVAGHFRRILAEPSGAPAKEWVETVPNDGLIRYLHLFNRERVMVVSPKALAEVLVHKSYDFRKPHALSKGLGRIFGVGILLAEGDEHKRQRKNLNPAFAFRHVKNLTPIFWEKAREMTEAMQTSIERTDATTEKPSNILDMNNWASRCTLDIIGLAGFGQDFHALSDPSHELNQTYRLIFNPTRAGRILGIARNFLPDWLVRSIPVKRNDDVKHAIDHIRATAMSLIQSKKRAMDEEKGRTGNDIISIALESGGFTESQLVDEVMTFLAAGHETTASAMTWAAMVLCQYPDVQRRLREEVREKLPSISDRDAQITALDIDHLPYLNAVCNEILRMYPPASLTLRVADKDTSILGQFIPQGTTIIICPWAVNTYTALWGPDANSFNPDRWLAPGQANSGGAESNYANLTFLHGPRSCIGQSFAKTEFACLLAAWAGRFEMEFADPKWELEIKGGITGKPKDMFCKLEAVEGW